MKIPKWVRVLSIAALAISLASIIFVLCRIEPITIDWLGILIGILAILVTALIGFHIYKIIEIESIVKKYNDLEDKLMKMIDDRFKDMPKLIDSIIEFKNKTTIEEEIKFMDKNMYWHAIELNFDRLSYCLSCYNSVDESAIIKIYQLTHLVVRGKELINREILDSEYFTKERKYNWINIMKKAEATKQIDNLYTNEILDFLEKQAPK